MLLMIAFTEMKAKNMGMREKIKRGEMTPKQALKVVRRDAFASPAFVRWCERRIRKGK